MQQSRVQRAGCEVIAVLFARSDSHYKSIDGCDVYDIDREKATLLYIVGCKPSDIPEIPMALGFASHVISTGSTNHIKKGAKGWRPAVSHAEREHTPPELAAWLVDLANRCKVEIAA